MRNRPLLRNLRSLQRAQYRHDQVAHQDIAGLPVPQRVTHFTLHFSKYVGGIAKALRENDQSSLRRLITDSFVIALAAANAMNVDLQRRMEEGMLAHEIRGLETENDRASLLLRYAEVVGTMSKASEALDHMEDFPSRKIQEAGVVLILAIIRLFADVIGLDLSSAAKDRWKAIEQKPLAGRDNGSAEQETVLPRVA